MSNMAKTVLIPIDDEYYYPNWVDGYGEIGWNVVGGIINFWNIGAAKVDILHIQWPEYLVKSGKINAETVNKIIKQMDLWRIHGTKIIGAINNIYPHGKSGDELYRRLYIGVYEKCDVLQHFSEASQNEFNKYYPELKLTRSIVSSLAGYAHVLKRKDENFISRDSFNIKNNDFVVMVFGALRSDEEWSLIRKAFNSLDTKNKKLFITQRFVPPGGIVVRNIKKIAYRLWIKWSGVVPLPEPLPDEKLSAIFGLTDVVVVPRIDDISSGIPGLAMTLGAMVIAPNHGAFPEYLAGSGNLLYKSGSVSSLVDVISRSINMDREKIKKENFIIAKNWSWKNIATECVRSIGM